MSTMERSMSNSPSQQSAGIATHAPRPGPHQGNGYLASAPKESIGDREWDEPVGREAQHQELIEAIFDRAEAYARLGDFEHAVEWLDRAATLGGDLPRTYQVKRARWDRASLRPGPRGWSITGAPDAEESFAFELTGTPEAGREARRALLARNRALPRAVRDDVLLLLTELVTNAVRHAHARPGQLVRVELRQRRGAVRVAVCDEGSGFARQATCSRPDETGGWGLVLVDRIADRWAVTRTATGTCVWFEIRYQQ
jgi:anti-sigma regulatory factor (Ser/Thr protein kinase)